MKNIYKIFILVTTTVSLFGCTLESNVVTLHPRQSYLVDEPIELQQSRSVVGRFNSQLIFLADQIDRNAERKSLDNTYIVTSFTNLNNLTETTQFGRLIAENIIHELQVRKWNVFEVRLNRDVMINETGEFSLSRDIKKIKDTYKVGGIVTGTYSITGNHVIVNARVIDINTGLVASSGQIRVPVDGFTEQLLYNGESSKMIRLVGDPSRSF